MYEFKFDVDRYVYMGVGSWLYVILQKQGLWALAEYRFSRWVLTEFRVPLVSKLEYVSYRGELADRDRNSRSGEIADAHKVD